MHVLEIGKKWGGIETYAYTYTDSVTEEIANIMHKNLIKGTPLKDRGIKRANFYVLRETNMPAVLVECGFMDNRKEAELLMSDDYRKECAKELAQAVCEIYGVDYIENSVNLTIVMGQSLANIKQMVSYTLKNNPKPQLPYCTLEELVDMYIEEGKIENVRADIAFAQSLKETGYFKYGGIVNPDMNNFAGIGALNTNENGNAAKFNTPRLGVRAQIQHLKAYASNDKLKQECVDPRFGLVKRNSAPFVEWLGAEDNPDKIGWAYPGKGYGYEIIKILDSILKESIEEKSEIPQWQIDAFETLKEKGVITDSDYWNRLDSKITIGECMSLLVSAINKKTKTIHDLILSEVIDTIKKSLY